MQRTTSNMDNATTAAAKSEASPVPVVDMAVVRERASLTLSLNNRAVREIADGRYEDAIVVLARALKTSKRALFHFEGTHRSLGHVTLTSCMMRTINRRSLLKASSSSRKKARTLKQQQQQEEGRWMASGNNGTTPNHDVNITSTVPQQSTTTTNAAVCGYSHADSTFLYDHGIMIPSNLPICYESSVLLSVAIIFNLALAYQLAASKNVDKKSRYLRKASKLYELAHDLQCDEGLDSVLLIAACVNNLGAIFRSSGDEKMTGKYFDHLLATIMFVTVNGDESARCPCIAGFIMNATEKLRHNNAAPAA
eukprot:CAMPEP_0113509578 /NCGR_PEP_ID=MMETSP0014_2-20120614/37656_1 /TAXON_ID=2857 /ORGANISM="Nitzschia sp." /LENGTH=308 /DNA_ID=CAMNT_0000405429 /DNA_START=123 /DNA_END=1049 /DNA_ORIENTATION=+ /assembly_acc=CAM_ASM_000159